MCQNTKLYTIYPFPKNLIYSILHAGNGAGMSSRGSKTSLECGPKNSTNTVQGTLSQVIEKMGDGMGMECIAHCKYGS